MAGITPPLLVHLDKRVYCHDSQVRLRLGIIDEIEINQLLELHVVSLHAVDNIREERAHILAHCHCCDKEWGGGLQIRTAAAAAQSAAMHPALNPAKACSAHIAMQQASHLI